MFWGSLEVKDLQLRRQLTRMCLQPPVGTRHLHCASQRDAGFASGVLASASRQCFPA